MVHYPITRSIFIDIHPDIFATNRDPTSPTLRSVTSKQKSKFLKYGANIDRKLKSCPYTNYLINSLDSTSDPKLLDDMVNSIDSQIGKFKKKAYNYFQCAPSFQAWSPIYRKKKILYHDALHYIRQYTSHDRLLIPIPSHVESNRPAILRFLRNHLKSVEKELKNAVSSTASNIFQIDYNKLILIIIQQKSNNLEIFFKAKLNAKHSDF